MLLQKFSEASIAGMIPAVVYFEEITNSCTSSSPRLMVTCIRGVKSMFLVFRPFDSDCIGSLPRLLFFSMEFVLIDIAVSKNSH